MLYVCALVFVVSFAQCATVKKAFPLDWKTASGENPLENARNNDKIAFVAFLKGGCPYCQSQATKLNAWFKRLKLSSTNFQLIIVNMVGDNEVQKLKDILKDTVNYTSYYQDTETLGIAKIMKAVKDDFFIFDKDGNLVKGKKKNGAFFHKLFPYVESGEKKTDFNIRCLCPVLKTLLDTLDHADKCPEDTLWKEINAKIALWIKDKMAGKSSDEIKNRTEKAGMIIRSVLLRTVLGGGHHRMGGGHHRMGGGRHGMGGGRHGMGGGHHGMGGRRRGKGRHGKGGGYHYKGDGHNHMGGGHKKKKGNKGGKNKDGMFWIFN